MSKVLIFSDAHIFPHKRKVERLEHCLQALDWVFETASEENIEDIIFGGDLFHDRQKIEVFTYMRTFDILKKHMRGDLRLWLLLGNHDLWYSDKYNISSVWPLSALPGVTVIDKPCRLQIAGEHFDFIPYTHNPLESLEALNLLPGKARWCIGHIALAGARLHALYNTYADVVVEHDGDMTVVDASIFKNYERVFLGHYHGEQQCGDNVEYIGSPLQLSFGEAFQQKHVIVFDSKTGKRRYIINKFSPQHLILKQTELAKHDLTNNFVQVLVDDISSIDLIHLRRDIAKKVNLGSLEIKQQQRKREDDRTIADAKAVLLKEDEMLVRYVDEVGTDGLDRDTLLLIGKKICERKFEANP